MLIKYKLDDALKKTLGFSYYENICGIIEDIMQRIDDIDNATDDDIIANINDSLIYYNDRWIVARHYNVDPANINWEETIENLICDCMVVLQYMQGVEIDEKA